MVDKTYSFNTDKIETRISGNSREIIGDVMTTSIDSYGTAFTDNAIDSFLRQLRTKKIMVDPEHMGAFLHNVKLAVKRILDKSGLSEKDVQKEVNTILKSIKYGDFPIKR